MPETNQGGCQHQPCGGRDSLADVQLEESMLGLSLAASKSCSRAPAAEPYDPVHWK